MDILIYGAGYNGRQFYSIMRQSYNSKDNIDAFIDRNNTGRVDGIQIIGVENTDLKSKRVVIAISSFEIAVEAFWYLRKCGCIDIWWFEKKRIKKTNDIYMDQCVDCNNWSGGAIKQVEMHIMDACNLNCRGCAHFSPIFEKEYPDINSRMRDVNILSKKISYIHEFYILGGEPFLNYQIGDYIERIRNVLPNTNLFIVTNGLLLLKIDEKILKIIRENEVVISISEYKPVHNIIDKIKNRLDNLGVKYWIRPIDDKKKFNRPLTVSGTTIHKKKCISDKCVTIWEGKISRCPTLMYIDRFNDYFSQELPNEGIISLNSDINGWDLVHYLEKDVPLCQYCVEDSIDWGTCNCPPLLEDFAVLD